MTEIDRYGNVIAQVPGEQRPAQAPVDMGGFPLRNVAALGLAGGVVLDAVPDGVLVLDRHSTVTLNVPEGAIVSSIAAPRRNVALLLLINQSTTPVLLVNGPDLRLGGGINRSLAQDELAVFIQFREGVWREIGGITGASEDLALLVLAAFGGRGLAQTFRSPAELFADATMTYDSGARAVQVGDPVDAGEARYEIAPQDDPAAHGQTQNGVKVFESGRLFTSRARFAAAVARGGYYRDQDVVWAGGRPFVKDGGSDLLDLPGWSEWLPTAIWAG